MDVFVPKSEWRTRHRIFHPFSYFSVYYKPRIIWKLLQIVFWSIPLKLLKTSLPRNVFLVHGMDFQNHRKKERTFRQLKQCTWNSLSTINFQIIYEFHIILPYEWQESYVSKNWSQSLYMGSTKKWEEQNFQIWKTKNILLFIMISLFLTITQIQQ